MCKFSNAMLWRPVFMAILSGVWNVQFIAQFIERVTALFHVRFSIKFSVQLIA